MATAARAPSGRKIWKAVRDELMLNLYPLPFSTIAPTTYHVYLHPDDFDAIDGVSARVVGQIQQALTAEVEKINQGLRRSARRVLSRLLDREDLPPIELPAGGWDVHLCADRNGNAWQRSGDEEPIAPNVLHCLQHQLSLFNQST